MPAFVGNTGSVTISSVSTLIFQNWSADESQDSLETTAFGNTGFRTYTPGLKTLTFSADGLVSGDLLVPTAAVSFSLSNGDKAIAGDCVITGLNRATASDGLVRFSLSATATDVFTVS